MVKAQKSETNGIHGEISATVFQIVFNRSCKIRASVVKIENYCIVSSRKCQSFSGNHFDTFAERPVNGFTHQKQSITLASLIFGFAVNLGGWSDLTYDH